MEGTFHVKGVNFSTKTDKVPQTRGLLYSLYAKASSPHAGKHPFPLNLPSG